MIKYCCKDFQKVQQCFPNLFYDKKGNYIKGEIEFSARYEKIKSKRGIPWDIVFCSSGKGCIQDCYEIKILLNNQNPLPRVFEIGGRIKELAVKRSRKIIDLHINYDESCCLGVRINSNIALSSFILNKVYPYFVWQAYFDKYGKMPPCGEYPHNKSEALKEFEKERHKSGRNDLCPCGSGEKYKNCCLG